MYWLFYELGSCYEKEFVNHCQVLCIKWSPLQYLKAISIEPWTYMGQGQVLLGTCSECEKQFY